MSIYTLSFSSLGLSLIAQVSHWHAGAPARLSGPPEDCYPEDPAEIEIESLAALDADGEERDATFLLDASDDIIERICEAAIEAMMESDE